ncbi:MAG: DUF1801 domain-containing protein [Janthinobacterium lividum]
MSARESIDDLIAAHPDWRGAALAELRAIILEVDPGIIEEWKYLGAPVWSLGGILVVGNIFKTKVKLGFMHGAKLDDPSGLFNGELGGKQRRSVELGEGAKVEKDALQDLIRAAILHNQTK